jgi:hypothetical protein
MECFNKCNEYVLWWGKIVKWCWGKWMSSIAEQNAMQNTNSGGWNMRFAHSLWGTNYPFLNIVYENHGQFVSAPDIYIFRSQQSITHIWLGKVAYIWTHILCFKCSAVDSEWNGSHRPYDAQYNCISSHVNMKRIRDAPQGIWAYVSFTNVNPPCVLFHANPYNGLEGFGGGVYHFFIIWTIQVVSKTALQHWKLI